MKCTIRHSRCVFADKEGACTENCLPCGARRSFSSPQEAAEAFELFISSHRGEILGLYQDSFHKWGGNGIPMAVGEVEKRYSETYDPDDMPEGEYDRIMQSVLWGKNE